MDIRELKLIRERLGLSQAEMAIAMGISERTFHALERGSERIKLIHRNAAWAAALAIADERRMPSLLPEELFLLMGRLVDESRRVTHR